jgi:hypothetical protein
MFSDILLSVLDDLFAEKFVIESNISENIPL